MDFQSLSRRELQALCKKNRIPANMTNVAMADALQALQTVEGIEEIKEAALFQSPEKANMRSPNLPCTSRRTSLRRAPVPDEPEGHQGSPLPRSRRVAIKASEIMKLVSEPEEIPKTPTVRTGTKPQAAPSTRRRARKKEQKELQEEEQKQEDALKEIPKTPAASTARNTRRRASRKEEAESHEGPLEVAITPATRYGRRALTRKGAEAAMAGEEKQEEAVGFRTTRRTGQSIRKRMEETTLDAAPGGGRRTTRAKAPVKMAALAQEEEEKKYITTEDLIDQNNHSVQIPDEKSDEVLIEEDEKNGAISDPCSRDSEMKNDGPGDGVQDSSTDGSDNGTTQDTNNSTLMWNNLGTEAEGEQISEEEVPEEEGGQQEDDVLSRLDESPIRGLVSSEINQQTNQEQEETLDGTPVENPTVTYGGSEDECRGGDTLDFALPDPSFSNEIKANGEESGHHLQETQAAGDLPLVQEILAVELYGEIEATRDQIPEDLIQSKEEEVNLNLLPIGKSLEETKVSGDELPVDLTPETEASFDLQGNLEIEDSPAKFLYDIPAAETNDSSDSFEIPEDTEESGAGITISGTGGTAPKTNMSIDLHFNLDTGDASAELYRRIPATETDDSGDVVELPEDTEESGVDILIGKQTAPGPESVLQAAASRRLQQSPLPFPIVQSSDATGSPSKILALDGDHIGDLAVSNVGSPAKISAQVGDITECALKSRTESSAKTVGELGDLTGDFTDSDLVTGAPVATPPDHGGSESDGHGIVLEVEGGEEVSMAIDIYRAGSGGGDDNKENNRDGSLLSGLTLVEVGGGEGRVKSKAEKPIQPDYNSLSMRKLKAILRKKASNLSNKKVEGKRAALCKLNDNCV